VIAKKNEIVATARADTARARTALRMAIRRQAAWRAARAATVQRLAGMAASDAILEAVEDRDEAVGAADRRATAAEQRERAILEKFGAVKSSLKYWRTAARRNARMRSDPAALRRLNRENHDLRAENFQLRVELTKAQKAKAPAAAVHVGKKPWLPRRDQTRGRPHGQKLRLLYMKYECLRVAPNVMNEVRAGRARASGARACLKKPVLDFWDHAGTADAPRDALEQAASNAPLPVVIRHCLVSFRRLDHRPSSRRRRKVFAATADAIVPEQLEEEGMELPDNQFCRNLRGEMAPLHNQVMSNTLADAKGVATTCVDATPWEQKEYLGGPMQVDEKGGARRDWCGVGIVQIGDQAAKAEALAVKEGIFDQLRNTQVLLHKAYAAKYGEAAAAAALPNASAIGVRQCVGGITLSDGASAALAGQRAFGELVVEDVKAAMGEEEYNKLAPEEQKRRTKVWCVTLLE
jgi:hypothetical protein